MTELQESEIRDALLRFWNMNYYAWIDSNVNQDFEKYFNTVYKHETNRFIYKLIAIFPQISRELH